MRTGWAPRQRGNPDGLAHPDKQPRKLPITTRVSTATPPPCPGASGLGRRQGRYEIDKFSRGRKNGESVPGAAQRCPARSLVVVTRVKGKHCCRIRLMQFFDSESPVHEAVRSFLVVKSSPPRGRSRVGPLSASRLPPGYTLETICCNTRGAYQDRMGPHGGSGGHALRPTTTTASART